MARITLLVLSLLFLFSSAKSQNKKFDTKKITYSLGYFGNNVWYPGLKAGADYPLFQKEKKKKRDRIVLKHFHLTGDVGFFWHPKKYLGTFTSYGIQKTRINYKGRRRTYALHPLGLFRTFLPETYKVSSSGDVSKVFLPGNFYYAPSASFGFGRNKKGKRFINSYMKASVTMLFNYNSSVLPLLNFEYGYRLTRKNNSNEIH